MFGIGWSEFVVIGVVALIAIGPKELPGVLRMVGQSLGKIRRMANEFQGQFQEAMREAEMADMRKEFDEISKSATDVADIDPIGDANREIDRALNDTPAEGAGETADATPLPEPPSPVEEERALAEAQPEPDPEPKQAGGAT